MARSTKTSLGATMERRRNTMETRNNSMRRWTQNSSTVPGSIGRTDPRNRAPSGGCDSGQTHPGPHSNTKLVSTLSLCLCTRHLVFFVFNPVHPSKVVNITKKWYCVEVLWDHVCVSTLNRRSRYGKNNTNMGSPVLLSVTPSRNVDIQVA